MNRTHDVIARYLRLREVRPGLQLMVLVDGLPYEEHFIERLAPRPGVHALFQGGPEAPLAYAGGWLIEPFVSGPLMTRDLIGLEPKAPSVCWFLTLHPPAELLPHLRRLLSVTSPDGRDALLRYYDPRVLNSLLRVTRLTEPPAPAQQPAPLSAVHPFVFALEWHLWLDGRRVHPTGLLREWSGQTC